MGGGGGGVANVCKSQHFPTSLFIKHQYAVCHGRFVYM